MKGFTKGEERSQITLLPECLDDYIGEDNLVRAVDELKLRKLGFGWPTRNVRPAPCRGRMQPTPCACRPCGGP